jgi:hypothetical protein
MLPEFALFGAAGITLVILAIVVLWHVLGVPHFRQVLGVPNLSLSPSPTPPSPTPPLDSFVFRSVLVLSDILLAVIVIELVATIRMQIGHLLDEWDGKREGILPSELPMNLLIIGVVAGIRHILAVGAQLTITSSTDLTARRSLMLEVSVDAVIVFLFALAWILAAKWAVKRGSEPQVAAEQPDALTAPGE